jgi:hypothetical protein
MNLLEVRNRKDLKNLILYIEENFKVNDWKMDGIHLWPIIRIRLYMLVMMEIENPEDKPKTTSKNQIKPAHAKRTFFKRVYNRLRLEYNKISMAYQKLRDKKKLKAWLKHLPQKDHLFVAHTFYRVIHEDKLYNRFFDTYIRQQNLGNNYLYLDGKLKLNTPYYRENQVYFYDEFKYIYHKTTKIKDINTYASINLFGYQDFEKFIKRLDHTKSFYRQFCLKNIHHYLTYIKKNLDFFTLVLNQSQPKRVYSLCYYGGDLPFIIALANKKKIQTIDYQHGPQTDVHMAYASWSQLPDQGYGMLPRNFWCWDAPSAKTITRWAKHHSLYQAEVVGNFWIDYWKTKAVTFKEKDFILYSLQPSPVKLRELFTRQILHFIKYQDYTWFLRLHPRQLDKKEKIVEFLKNEGVYDLVEIEEATTQPLPLLLANCHIHLTQYSGCAIEASLMDKTTVFLNNIGKEAFPDMIKEKKGRYLDPESEAFEKQLIRLLEQTSHRI